MQRVRKAVATLYATLPNLLAAGIALGVLDGDAQKWVLGLAASLTVPLAYLGVYKAPANAPE